jgi:zinc transport system substrate-binding protein
MRDRRGDVKARRPPGRHRRRRPVRVHAGFIPRKCRALRNLSLTGLLVATLAVACSGERTNTGARPAVFVSILPQAYFVERIAGGRVDLHVVVGPGQSPETYEPTAKQLSLLADSRILFTIGMPFERALMPRIRANFPGVAIVDTHAGIPLRGMWEERSAAARQPPPDAKDPHVWMDPRLAKTLAKNILDAITAVLPDEAADLQANFDTLAADLDSLDAEISRMLKPLAGRDIVVYHPAYGYFCDAYGLRQVAIEVGGVEPGSRYLADLIASLREGGVKVIFVEPQSAQTTAEAVAHAIGGRVAVLDPLASDYIENLRRIAIEIHSVLQER